MAHVIPQYDSYGLDSGLWLLYDEQYDGVAECVYECLSLRTRHETLIVGQYPDWDYESYDKNGFPDAEFIEVGYLDCPNPFMDEDAANILYNWLLDNDKAVTA